MSKSAPTLNRKGFTLIEVMVSTAIMIVIVLAVVTVASDTFKAYDKAVADLTSQSEARGVLDAFEADFQTAVLRPDGRCWMEVVIPGSSKAPSPLSSANVVVVNVNPIDQPVVMLFSSPADRPRWSPELSGGKRVQFKGDVCAVAYRLGQSSPFDSPGDPIQRVYGVYRTIIDPENTFKEAIPEILYEKPTAATLVPSTAASNPYKSPISYWGSGSHKYANYTPDSGDAKFETKVLMGTEGASSTSPSWTLNQSNFIGANVVSMNFIFWCSSTLSPQPTAKVVGALYDPLARPAEVLRPVIAESTTSDPLRFSSGYAGAFSYSTSVRTVTSSSSAELRWASAGGNVPASSAKTPHPVDAFGSRLLVCSDRIYTDQNTTPSVSTATALKYLPYRLRAVEVSITILTPEGSKELRALQNLNGTKGVTGVKIDPDDFKRIVSQYGKNFTRYIRLLGNGG